MPELRFIYEKEIVLNKRNGFLRKNVSLWLALNMAIFTISGFAFYFEQSDSSFIMPTNNISPVNYLYEMHEKIKLS